MQPDNHTQTGTESVSALPAVALYSSEVMHRRVFPVSYRFTYRTMNLLIDIDRLDQSNGLSRIFSINRWNFLSFYPRDHLPKDKQDHTLRQWAQLILARFAIQDVPARVHILCFPRVFGWVFNPISVWYCIRDDGQPLAVICEVNNTFGEKHYYLLHGKETDLKWPVHQSHAKNFHVSPFINMDADYEFRIGKPDATATVGIRESQHGELMLVAAVKGKQVAFNTANLLRQSLRVPFQTLKVLAAIHWHALWIWLAGTPFYTKPPAPKNEVS